MNATAPTITPRDAKRVETLNDRFARTYSHTSIDVGALIREDGTVLVFARGHMGNIFSRSYPVDSNMNIVFGNARRDINSAAWSR